MIEILEFTKKEIKKKIKFDEILNIHGIWENSKTEYSKNQIKKLKYSSIDYTYYIFEDTDKYHTIFRNRK